jgi:hypothetical protein
MKKYLIILLAILSACSVRKVQTNKSTTEIKETSVQTLKQSDTTKAVSKEIVNFLDTSKTTTENKTVIEVYDTIGRLIQRVTSYDKVNLSNYIIKNVVKKDSTFLSSTKELKDSSVVSVKQVEKVKQSERSSANFLIFAIILCFVAFAAYMLLKK